MSYKAYEDYKESYIDWIGLIPAHWSLSRLKFLAEIVTGSTPSKNDDTYYKEGTFPWVKPDDLKGLNPITTTNVLINDEGKRVSRIVPKDSILVCCIGSLGKIGIAGTQLSTNQQINSIIPNKLLKNNYCKYMVIASSSEYDKYSNSNVVSIINKQQQGELNYPIPPIEEQKQIAKYLDKKTARIDATIAKNEELIQLLEEKRVALINQVVTKGLNPDTPMKDSGVEWIGEIPEHWKIKRLKYNCSVNLRDKKSVSDEDLKINFLPMEKVSEDGWYDLESMSSYSSISKGYTYFENDDVLVAKITPCFENGKIALLKNLKYGFGFGSTEFHVLRFKEHILPEFIYYLIKSYAFRTIGQAFMHGTAGQKRVGTDFIENYMMVTPPIEEQQDIINYLNHEINKLTNSISKIQESIALLEEYKTSLIHHVVTGKIDVRGEEI